MEIHFNSGTLGYFRTSGIDTTTAPPQSSTVPTRIRQNPALTNLYSNELTALELWIESSRDQNGLAIGENLGDYFNMLNLFDASNPLQRKGIVCDSDSHSRTGWSPYTTCKLSKRESASRRPRRR